MPTKDKIYSLPSFLEVLADWRANQQKVVFTNGCFDLIHIGHVDYLEKAKALGNKLIVGVNSDDSVSRFKGPSRPIVNEESRYRVLAAMEFIDAIVPFNEDTPLCLIEQVSPDVLVKGNDYLSEETNPNAPRYIVGSDIVREKGGRVDTIELTEGFSTSALIERIKNA